jgi:hypothetical protein
LQPPDPARSWPLSCCTFASVIEWPSNPWTSSWSSHKIHSFFYFAMSLENWLVLEFRGTESSSSIEGKRERSKLASCQVWSSSSPAAVADSIVKS